MLPKVRSLAAADLPLVRQWMRDAPEAPAWNEAELARLVSLSPNTPPVEHRLRFACVADDANGQLVGFAIANALLVPELVAECELEFLLVTPPARRMGVGRALLNAVLAGARDRGAQEMWLEVRASNLSAQRLYLERGFAAAGRRPAYYADPLEDAVLMRCRIAGSSGGAPL